MQCTQCGLDQGRRGASNGSRRSAAMHHGGTVKCWLETVCALANVDRLSRLCPALQAWASAGCVRHRTDAACQMLRSSSVDCLSELLT